MEHGAPCRCAVDVPGTHANVEGIEVVHVHVCAAVKSTWSSGSVPILGTAVSRGLKSFDDPWFIVVHDGSCAST